MLRGRYFRFFCSFNEALSLFQRFNSLHRSLTFNMDEEKDNHLPFLDVLVDRRSFAFVTSIYRKPLFTGFHLVWDAFDFKSMKVYLIKCLTFKFLKICSDNRIKSEFEQINRLFWGNGYSEEVIFDTINKTVDKFMNNIRSFGPPKCPVYVRLYGIGSPSQLIADKVSFSVIRRYNTVMVRNLFTARAAFCYTPKDMLPIFKQSNLIYKFQCCCNAAYIRRTSHCLRVRIKLHVPRDIRNRTTSGHSKLLDIANCEHLNAINSCAVNYNDKCFSVLQ